MSSDLIHDRGRGPELVGTRITVYNLLEYFLDPTATEAYICKLYDVTPEQIAAMRAYVLNHADEVLAQHLKIEARIAEGNSQEVREQTKRTHDLLLRFKEWLATRAKTGEQANAVKATAVPRTSETSPQLPTFREWLAEEKARAAEGS